MKIKINLVKFSFPIFSILLLSNNSTNAQSLENVLIGNENEIKEEIILVKTGRYKEAILKLESKSIKFPNNPSIYYYLGKAYEKEKNLTESLKNYNNATKIDPNYAKPYMAIALLKGKENKLEDTIRFLDKAISVKPNYAKAYSNRGVAKGALSNNTGAITDFNKAINIDPLLSEAYINRGITHELMGNIKLACSDWKSAKSLGNIKASPWFNDQCKNIPLDEVNIGAINTDLLNEVNSLKEMVKNQEKALNEVINAKPLYSDSSKLQNMQIGFIPENKTIVESPNQDISDNSITKSPQKKLNSIEKARLKLNSLVTNLEKNSLDDKNLTIPFDNVNSKKEDEEKTSDISKDKNLITKTVTSSVKSTSTTQENISTNLPLVSAKPNLKTNSANLAVVSVDTNPKTKSSILPVVSVDKNTKTNPTVLPVISVDTSPKKETIEEKIKIDSNNSFDTISLVANQPKKSKNPVVIQPSNTLKVSPINYPLANNDNPNDFNEKNSISVPNQYRFNNLNSSIGTFSLGFFIATSFLLLIDKLKRNRNGYQNNNRFNGNNIYPNSIKESLNSNREMDLDLKETSKVIDKTNFLINSLNEQKLIIENEIKILKLDLDFLKIKQSNLKVYCLSKYRNEIGNNDEYKLNPTFYLNKTKNGKLSFNSENFSI